MKKIISIFLVVVLALSMTATSFAKYDDIFYCDSSDEKVQKAISEYKNVLLSTIAAHIQKFHIKDGSQVDANKIKFDNEHVMAAYGWYSGDYDALIEFMKSDDKEKLLKESKINMIWCPIYYDGEFVQTWNLIMAELDGKLSITTSDPVRITRKEDIETVLKAENIVGYNLLQYVLIDGIHYVIAEKDGQTVAIYLPVQKHLPMCETVDFGETSELYKQFKADFDRRVITIDQFEEIAKYSKELTEINIEIHKNTPDEVLVEGGTQTADTEGAGTVNSEAEDTQSADMPLAEDEPEKSSPVIWIVLGVIVLVAAGAVTIALIKKKKA